MIVVVIVCIVVVVVTLLFHLELHHVVVLVLLLLLLLLLSLQQVLYLLLLLLELILIHVERCGDLKSVQVDTTHTIAAVLHGNVKRPLNGSPRVMLARGRSGTRQSNATRLSIGLALEGGSA